MGADHDETFLQGLLANLRQEERLPMAGTIDLRARLQELAFWNLVQILETSGNGHLQTGAGSAGSHDRSKALPER